MATRNLVPRNSGEGSVGRLDKAWSTGVFDNLFFGGLEISMDQNVRTLDSVEFLSGNFVNGLTLGGVDVKQLGTSISQVVSGAAEFVFVSNVTDNNGVANKTYYETPNPDLHLSGIEVASASNLKVELQWDGPNDKYVGDAYINGQKIPSSNITQLGQDTRRFEGYIDNFNAIGLTKITGEANGRFSEISLTELGAGPEASNIFIDQIDNATPKQGQLLGATHLKEGDLIDIFVNFDTDDIASIKVHDHGLAKEIDFTQYPLTNTNGTYQAIIPVEVSNRSGPSSVAVQAINFFGSTGELKESTDFSHQSGLRDLDQSYPVIQSSAPLDYNGRSDGLRDGESSTFSNTVSNWDLSSDVITYSSLNNDLLINNPQIFEAAKTVSHLNGIYSDSENLQIYAARTNNGATDTELINIKVANGPQITGATLSSLASSSIAPHSIGNSEIKAGDIIDSNLFVDGKGTSIDNITISILDEGISDGSQSSYGGSYAKQTMQDGSFKFSIPIKVFGPVGSNVRDGDRVANFKVKNNFNTVSDQFATTNTARLNNGDIPSVSINSITYPGAQQAIKATESALAENTVSNFNFVEYSSPNSELSITNPTVFEASKTLDYFQGGYNIKSDGGQNNLKISAIKSSNGVRVEAQDVVSIANTPLEISINNLATSLSSSETGLSDQFYISSSQVMLSSPSLSVDPLQTNPSSLNQNSSGTSETSNSYTLTVLDANSKGSFNWQISAVNLANIETISISSNPTYTLSGFSSRSVTSSPNSLGAGLAYIGTTVSNINDVNFENLSEGGVAPNGGTLYAYQSYPNGTQLDNSYNINNKFAVCDSLGLTSENGDHIFNLDKLNRAANSSVASPATFVIKED